jgi:hypothetical protein
MDMSSIPVDVCWEMVDEEEEEEEWM